MSKKSSCKVTDSGYRETFAGVRDLSRRSAQVGVDDAQAAEYAPIIERDYAPFRDAMDVKRNTAQIVEQATEGKASEALEQYAAELADDVRRNLGERGLVDTGRLRDSVRGVAR